MSRYKCKYQIGVIFFPLSVSRQSNNVILATNWEFKTCGVNPASDSRLQLKKGKFSCGFQESECFQGFAHGSMSSLIKLMKVHEK